jgi:hypothetical protein
MRIIYSNKYQFKVVFNQMVIDCILANLDCFRQYDVGVNGLLFSDFVVKVNTMLTKKVNRHRTSCPALDITKNQNIYIKTLRI